MSRPTRSPEEDIAGFLDGTLSAAERQRVLDRAAADPETYALLADAAATLTALDAEEEERSGVAAWRARLHYFRRPLPLSVAGLAAAAILATVLFLPAGDDATAALLPLAGSIPTAALPGGTATLATPPWGATRGADPAAEEARVLRTGARLADLAAAAAAGDAAVAATIASDLARVVDGLVGGAPVVAALREAEAAAAREDGSWREAVDQATWSVVAVFESPLLRVGVWAESARLAVLAGGERPDPRRLAAAGRDVAADAAPALAGEIRAIADLLDATGPAQHGEVLRRLDALLGIR